MSIADSIPVAAESRLDEQALRRPDWLGGTPIKLSDGQEWSFPKPKMLSSVRKDEAGVIRPHERCSFGPGYLAKLDAWRKSEAAAGDGERARADALQVAQFDTFIALLRINYDLDFDEAAGLISFDFDDPAELDRYIDLSRLAQGVSPKPPGDGSPAA